MIKTINKLGKEGNSQTNKDMYQNSTANIIINKTEHIAPQIREKQECPLSPVLFSIV